MGGVYDCNMSGQEPLGHQRTRFAFLGRITFHCAQHPSATFNTEWIFLVRIKPSFASYLHAAQRVGLSHLRDL